MTITRLQLETATRAVMDATSAARWSDTELRHALGFVHGRGWRKILNANRTYRWAQRTVTQDNSGRAAWSALSSGSADSQERAYRVLAAADGQMRYTVGDFMDDPLAATAETLSQQRRVWKQGDYLQFTPVSAGASVTVWVNHLPTSHSALAGDGSTVAWPDDDYLLILAYEGAAHLLMKGGAETEAAREFQQMADAMWPDLLTEVQRWSTDPLVVAAPDKAWEWGG